MYMSLSTDGVAKEGLSNVQPGWILNPGPPGWQSVLPTALTSYTEAVSRTALTSQVLEGNGPRECTKFKLRPGLNVGLNMHLTKLRF